MDPAAERHPYGCGVALNWVDIVILVLVLGGAFSGWRNGLLRWVLTLAGALVGAVIAGQFYDDLAGAVPGVDSEALRQIIAFAAVFLAVVVGAWLLARVIKAALNVVLLGWVDSAAGLAAGAMVGAVSAAAILSVAGIVPSDSVRSAVADSSLAETLLDAMGFIRVFLPGEFDAIEDLFRNWGTIPGLN